jgi:hypothetical protein
LTRDNQRNNTRAKVYFNAVWSKIDALFYSLLFLLLNQCFESIFVLKKVERRKAKYKLDPLSCLESTSGMRTHSERLETLSMNKARVSLQEVPFPLAEPYPYLPKPKPLHMKLVKH